MPVCNQSCSRQRKEKKEGFRAITTIEGQNKLFATLILYRLICGIQDSAAATSNDFDFEYEDGIRAKTSKERDSFVSPKTKVARSTGRSTVEVSIESSKKAIKELAAKQLVAPPARSPAQASLSQTVAKGRASASHESPSSAALKRLEQNGRKVPRRGTPSVPPTPSPPAPPKAKRRRL